MRAEARLKIAAFYNTRRMHSFARQATPIDFEQQITTARTATKARFQKAMEHNRVSALSGD
jgi:hypothetical protein